MPPSLDIPALVRARGSSDYVKLPHFAIISGTFVSAQIDSHALRLLLPASGSSSGSGPRVTLHLVLDCSGLRGAARREIDERWAALKTRMGREVRITQGIGAKRGREKDVRLVVKQGPRGGVAGLEVRGKLELGVRVQVLGREGGEDEVFEFAGLPPVASWLSSQSDRETPIPSVRATDRTKSHRTTADPADEVDELMSDSERVPAQPVASSKRARSPSNEHADPGPTTDPKRARLGPSGPGRKPLVRGWAEADMVPTPAPGPPRHAKGTTSISHLTTMAFDPLQALHQEQQQQAQRKRKNGAQAEVPRVYTRSSSPFDASYDPIQRASGTVAPFTPGPSSPPGGAGVAKEGRMLDETEKAQEAVPAGGVAGPNSALGSSKQPLGTSQDRSGNASAPPAPVAAPSTKSAAPPKGGGAAVEARLAQQAISERKATRKQRKAANKAKKHAEQQAQQEQKLVERDARLLERFAADPKLRWQGLSRGGMPFIYETLDAVGANIEGQQPGFKSTIVNLMVSVKHVAEIPRRDSRNDYSYFIEAQDPTRHRDDFTKITFYSRSNVNMAGVLKTGDVVLIRTVMVQRRDSNKYRLSGQCSANSAWEVLALRMGSNGEVAWTSITSSRPRPISDYSAQEQQHLQMLARWTISQRVEAATSERTAEGDSSRSSKRGRETVTLSHVRAGEFFDIACLQIVGRLRSPDDMMHNLLVTDFTIGQFAAYANQDVPGLEPGMLMEITFYDDEACSNVQNLKNGTYLSLRNLQGRMDTRGNIAGRYRMRTAGQADNLEFRNQIKVLAEDDPAVLVVKQRQADVAAGIRQGPQVPAPAIPASVAQPAEEEAAGSESESETESDIERADIIAKDHPVNVRAMHPEQELSTFEEVLACPTVPNRFKVKALVSSFMPSKPPQMLIKWCKTCKCRFHGNGCAQCTDDNAELRWRFAAVLKEKRGKRNSELPVTLQHDLLRELLTPLPSLSRPQDKAEADDQQAMLKKMANDIANILLGYKIDNVRPCPPYIWNIESYLAEDPEGHQHRMFRAFDMVES